LFKNEKRKREQNDTDDDDEEDVVEVKPRHSSVFKRDDDEDEEVEELLQNKLLQNFDAATWGLEPQSPWSQHTEQSNVIVPLSLDPVQTPGVYTLQGVGLYYLILSPFNFYLVTYKVDGELPIQWEEVEEKLLTGWLPSQL
jgi:hypothetical protein